MQYIRSLLYASTEYKEGGKRKDRKIKERTK